jgi:hypothetical protein
MCHRHHLYGLELLATIRDAYKEAKAFISLIGFLNPSKLNQPHQQNFVKQLESIHQLDLLSPKPRRKALIMSEQSLVGNFTCL